MMPRKPILWLILFVTTIFASQVGLNYAMSDDLSLFREGVWALLTGFATMGLFYIADNIRNQWFAEESKSA